MPERPRARRRRPRRPARGPRSHRCRRALRLPVTGDSAAGSLGRPDPPRAAHDAASQTMVILPGDGAASPAGVGRAEIVRETADEIEIDVDATADSVLVVQRTFHEIYRATVDGEGAVLEPANVHRLGVAVPAGEHRVRIWADRGPTRWGWGLALLGVTGLIVTTSVVRFSGSRSSQT